MLGRSRLGRKRTATPALKATRLCPVCGERKAPKEFVPRAGRKRRTGLNPYCNRCRLDNKQGVKGLFYAGRPALKGRGHDATQFLTVLARRRLAKGRRGIQHMTAEEYATKLAKLPDRVAAVVAKTYAVMGDDFQVADDQALMMIRDYLDELDETVIERNRNKKLSRR